MNVETTSEPMPAASAPAASAPAASAPAPSIAAPDHDAAAVERVRRRMTSPVLLPLFMLAKMPLGFVAGLRVKTLEPGRCEVTIPYGWRTTNPFRSMYFAAQSMAAELSTGALAMLATELAPSPVAMLIVDLEAGFTKKADREVTFACEAGEELFAAVRRTSETGEPATARVETVGRMADGTEVARFFFTWSFKKRAVR